MLDELALTRAVAAEATGVATATVAHELANEEEGAEPEQDRRMTATTKHRKVSLGSSVGRRSRAGNLLAVRTAFTASTQYTYRCRRSLAHPTPYSTAPNDPSVKPPSTTSTCPVVKSLAEEAR